jgi:hypothetical protein
VRVSTNQRLTVLSAVLIIAALTGLVAQSEPSWYLVTAVLLAICFLILSLPPKTPAPLPIGPIRTTRGAASAVWEVTVEVDGVLNLIVDRLRADEWTVGGSGPATAPGRSLVTLEVSGQSRSEVCRAAGRAVRQTGAHVMRVSKVEVVK